MNAAELRYKIYQGLTSVADIASLDSPEPGKPLTISLYVPDPYAPIGQSRPRHYTVTIEETVPGS